MLRLVLLSLAVVAGSAMVCLPETCSWLHCKPVREEDCIGGRFVKNGGLCGCCHICVYSMVHTKAQTCAKRRHEIDVARHHGFNPLGQFIPSCAPDGSYAPLQCFGGGCYCVNSMGKKIWDYNIDIGHVAKLDCECVRFLDAYTKMGWIGKLFFCIKNDSYQRYPR